MKGIKLVAIVMAVMVIIGTMMVPAHADYERTATFEERFEVLFDLYLEREGLEDYLVIGHIEELEETDLIAHLVRIEFTDEATELIKEENDIESDDVYAVVDLTIFADRSWKMIAELWVDDAIFETEMDDGDDILWSFDLI